MKFVLFFNNGCFIEIADAVQIVTSEYLMCFKFEVDWQLPIDISATSSHTGQKNPLSTR